MILDYGKGFLMGKSMILINMGRRATTERPPFGRHLLELRSKAGLTAEELGKRVGKGKSTVIAWEVNGNIGEATMIPKVAHALGVSLEELLNTKPVRNGHPGKIGILEEVFREASQLPRSRQKHLARLIAGMVEAERVHSDPT